MLILLTVTEIKSTYTVDLVIFMCLNFREFLIWGSFTKFRIPKLSFFFSAIIKILIARFVNSRICHLAKFVKIKTSRKLLDLQYRYMNSLSEFRYYIVYESGPTVIQPWLNRLAGYRLSD